MLSCPQRFHAGAVLVNNRRQDLITESVQLLRCPLLWHKTVLKPVSVASTKPLTVISAFGRWVGPRPNVEFAGVTKST